MCPPSAAIGYTEEHHWHHVEIAGLQIQNWDIIAQK
jgi:hypothetical protein